MTTTDKLEEGRLPVNPLETVLTTSLAREAHDLVRHLGDVLALRTNERVLLVPGDVGMTALTLVQTFDCHVTMLAETGNAVEPSDPRIVVEHSTLASLPFADGSFDAVIVARPISSNLFGTTRELARVLRHAGRLGLVALSAYGDQVSTDSAANGPEQMVLTRTRPAAVYRAVLGEAGFTAFITEDRRRAVRRSAAAVYREHLIRHEPEDTALTLLASGGLSVTLITAEKAL